MSDITEKKKTSENSKSNILTAKVIANWGDPGLQEDFGFDILSRLLIVMLESTDRIPTSDKWMGMLAAVLRPKTLWIDAVGGQAANPTDQQRADQLGNTNIGVGGNFSVNAISTINQSYQIGEIIHIQKLTKPWLLNQQTQDKIFQSVFINPPAQPWNYGPYYSAGSSIPYI